MNDTEKLAGLIPFGRENAVSREALAEKMGMGDRAMRKAIERARAEGLMICNEQEENGGYYQSNNVNELLRQYRRDTARALSVLKRRKPMRDALIAAGIPKGDL